MGRGSVWSSTPLKLIGKLTTENETKGKGDLSELAVAKRLKELGYTVSMTFAESARYDLIYDDGEELYRAQVKTGEIRENKFLFRCQNTSTKNGEVVKKPYTSDEIDVFLVYVAEKDEVYEIPIDEAPKTRMDLRFESKRDTQKINWASDYVLE